LRKSKRQEEPITWRPSFEKKRKKKKGEISTKQPKRTPRKIKRAKNGENRQHPPQMEQRNVVEVAPSSSPQLFSSSVVCLLFSVSFIRNMDFLCASCGQEIVGEVTEALGKKYHPEHFVCATCSQPFSGAFFPGEDGFFFFFFLSFQISICC
jgi:hypothetical protein